MNLAGSEQETMPYFVSEDQEGKKAMGKGCKCRVTGRVQESIRLARPVCFIACLLCTRDINCRDSDSGLLGPSSR